MISQKAILKKLVGPFDYDSYRHPLFRDGSQQASLWGRFAIRSTDQNSDINATNTLNMGTAKVPAATTIGATAQNGNT